MKKEIPEQKSTEIKKVIAHRIKDFAALYRSGPDLYFYKRVMQMNGQSQDLDEFIDNEYNLELLYATLVAWDMNSRGAKLKYFDDFKDSILSNRHHLKMLWKKKLEEIEDIEAIIEVLGAMYDNLHLMKGQGRLVSNSKLLHFVCPELLMPMDRSNTLVYFYKHTNESKDKYLNIIRWTYAMVKDQSIDWITYLDEEWNTTIPKILDNAVILKNNKSVRKSE